jgi:RimJ/RimL family protein N-acetyltransferase
MLIDNIGMQRAAEKIGFTTPDWRGRSCKE